MILHAGTHKTGTTSIQRTLASNREWLRDHGIRYPDTRPFLGGSRDGHFRVAHALTGTDPAALQAVRDLAAHLAAEASDEETVVLSAEPVYRHVAGTRDTWSVPDYWPRRERYLATVAEVFADFDVTVLLHLRDHASLAESLYLEAVAAGTCRSSFERFLVDRQPFFDYSAQVRAFEGVFDDVVVERYRGDAVGAVLTRLGLPEPPTGSATIARRSPDPRLALWLRTGTAADRRRRRRFLGSPWARGALPDGEPGGLWRSAAQRDAFVAQFKGPYGHDFFPAEATPVPPPVVLTPRLRRALDRRYRLWCLADTVTRHRDAAGGGRHG